MALYSPTDSGSNTPLSPVENFESNVEKKLLGVTSRQDSIQTLSLWLIHHKSQCQKITQVWFKIIKKAKIQHRLTLFYLANDVLQNCKRKNAKIYLLAFKSVLKEAIVYVRDPSIRSNLERMLNIWDERNVYKGAFVEELKGLLVDTKKRSNANSKIISEFKPAVLIESINSFKSFESEVEFKQKQLSNLRLDASDLEAVRQLKDKAHGHEFSKHFEESCSTIEKFVDNLHKQVKDQRKMIELLEKSELFYETQYGEARIVANAYKNFGTRISNLKKRLADHKKTLPSPFNSPCASPSMDAPSPGNTPPPDPTLDNTEAVDMDFSDSGESDAAEILTAKPTVKSSVTKVVHVEEDVKDTRKRSRDDESTHKRRHSSSSSKSRKSGNGHHSSKNHRESSHGKSSEHQKSPQGSSSKERELPVYVPPPVKRRTKVEILSGADSEGRTPDKDESGGTPTQDEPPDTSNPIDFLTKLINKTQKSGGTVNSNFLQNLSLLTNTVKQAKQENKKPEPPMSWAELRKTQGDDDRGTSVAAALAQPSPITPASVTSVQQPVYQAGYPSQPTTAGYGSTAIQGYPSTIAPGYPPPQPGAAIPTYQPLQESPPVQHPQPGYAAPPTPPVQSQASYQAIQGSLSARVPTGFQQAQSQPPQNVPTGYQQVVHQLPGQSSQPYAVPPAQSGPYPGTQQTQPAQSPGYQPLDQQGMPSYATPSSAGYPGMLRNTDPVYGSTLPGSQPYQHVVSTSGFPAQQLPTAVTSQSYPQRMPVSVPYMPSGPPQNDGPGFQPPDQNRQLSSSGGFNPQFNTLQRTVGQPTSPQPPVHPTPPQMQGFLAMSQPPPRFNALQGMVGNQHQVRPMMNTAKMPPQSPQPPKSPISSPTPPSLPPPPRGILRNRSNSNNVEIKTVPLSDEESSTSTNIRTIPTIGGVGNKPQGNPPGPVASTKPKLVRPPPNPPGSALKTLSMPSPGGETANSDFIEKLKRRSSNPGLNDSLPKPSNPNLTLVSSTEDLVSGANADALRVESHDSGIDDGQHKEKYAKLDSNTALTMIEKEVANMASMSEPVGNRIGTITDAHKQSHNADMRFASGGNFGNPKEFSPHRGPRPDAYFNRGHPRRGGPPPRPFGREPFPRHRPPFRGSRPPPPGGYFDRSPRPRFPPRY